METGSLTREIPVTNNSKLNLIDSVHTGENPLVQ